MIYCTLTLLLVYKVLYKKIDILYCDHCFQGLRIAHVGVVEHINAGFMGRIELP